MPRRLRQLACLLLLCVPLAGCWVIEEIDKGQAILDAHSAKQEEAPTPGAPAAPAGGLDAYFAEQDKQGKTRSFTPGQVSEGIVACKLGKTTQFTTRESCAARGGHAG